MFLQHGALLSSSSWIVLEREISLAYQFADKGFDVWLGNARGNTYSKNHINLTWESEKFWDFSFHEVGVLDLPAMINTILKITSKSHLNIVSYCQGATEFFVMCSELKEMNSKIKSAHVIGENFSMLIVKYFLNYM